MSKWYDKPTKILSMKKDIDYNKLKPIYSLRADFAKIPKGNISEQLKSLNKPYIPGSSIKGAIMNAVFYDFIKNKLGYIRSIILNFADVEREFSFCSSVLAMIGFLVTSFIFALW